MMFKLSTIVLAAAALVVSSPVERRGTADCTYVATPSGIPDTSSTPLFSEWNYLIGRNFAENFPNTLIDGTNSTVTVPEDVTGAYTVVKAVGTAAITDAEAIAIVTGWVGSTFEGPWTGVTWHIDSVTC